MPNFNFNMFQGNKQKNVQKSLKDLGHEWKHDLDLGTLVPCLWLPTLPGDEFINLRSQFFFKCEPLQYPLIHRLNMVVDYWWVRNGAMWPDMYTGPERLVKGWEDWIMLKTNDPHPVVDADMNWYETGSLNNTVGGYFGLPYLWAGEAGRSNTIQGLNAFPFMAYLMIYDQGYRHPQLEEAYASYRLNAGDNTANMSEMYNAMYPTNVDTNRYRVFPSKWGKDYLTSCLPTPQVGDPVLIPTFGIGSDGVAVPQSIKNLDGNINVGGALSTTGTGTLGSSSELTHGGQVVVEGSATIRELSIASVLQTLKEQLMKVGQRYKDWIDWAFDENVDPLDINVPVMIGSFKGSIQISEVLTQANTQTNAGDSNWYTGDYTGNAGLYETGMQGINFKCKDYGILMAIMTVTPNTGYGQGINRYWRYANPVDYPMDIFSTVGDQEVLKEEAFYSNVIADADRNQETFGYIPRYSEASFINNNYGTNLAWNAGKSVHLGKLYDVDSVFGTVMDDKIVISLDYLRADQNFSGGSGTNGGTRVRDAFRVLTFPNGLASQMPITAYVLHDIKVLRPLPQYSTPGLGA